MHISGFKMRSRLPGDRFKPIGMKGRSLKLSDFMVNVKLPQAARPGYPSGMRGMRSEWER